MRSSVRLRVETPAEPEAESRAASSPLDAIMAPYRGRPVFFDPLSGNNGDRLITAGSEEALRTWQVRRVARPAEADLIVVNGGGGMLDYYGPPLAALRSFLERFPSTRVVVLPQSYHFEKVDFAAVFADRRAPVTLFARERYSREWLRKAALPPAVRCELDHDMAFRLRGSTFLADLRSRARERHVLFVERRDAESMGAGARPAMRVPLKRIAPAALKRPLKRWWVQARERSSGRRTPFFELAYGTAVAERPELRRLPVYAADVSDHSMHHFAGFCRAIADAAAVVTNRLHVAILGALLEKPVWVSTGAYHKIRGIYEHSLADDPRVRLLEDGARR